ncbi:MAG TPA: glycoside hydrolase family 2 TIM barrel-domain containing protein [Gaiellaceae bacterium]|nr:glycoside hydrolase family 2 TIM barrel-domain containing protein [Gaiellaceae bacterium]
MKRSLDGDGWQLRACLGDEWRWHAGPAKSWDAPGWLPARVPGSVLDDLVRAGEAPSPYHERDSRACEWVSQRAWLYRRRVVLDAPLLRFGGVDHACTVLLDGEVVAEHEGMFTPFEVGVHVRADGREHLLAVVVHPAPRSEPQVGRTSRVRVHKARMDYGWDFCPRLVHQGIWRSVDLVDAAERLPLVQLRDGVGTVEVAGEVVLRVEQPDLWWPSGMGEQRLYDAGGFAVGFRTVELDGYRFVVNGVPMYVRGWNWCPLDPLYGVPRPAKLERLLRLARNANVNVLRVWGGGLIESTEFYELCDRFGILVWQEFSQSSSGIESVPAADDEFVELMRREAREIVPRRRRHPSLALWCGGNELARRAEGRDDVPLDDSHPVLGALRGVVRELDPNRAWLPTSPSGPRFLNRLDVIEQDPDGLHDVHGPWEHQGLRDQYRLYDAGTAILHSEFGVEGMANRAAIEELVDEQHRWPADRTNPVYEHLGAWWNNAPLVQECFGGRIDDLDTLRRASQWLQYDGLRYAVEANMRRARSAGVLPWQFAESFPNAWCTSAVDWHAQPKPAYWGVARAYRPGHPSAQFATCAWGGMREVRARIHGDATARLVRLDGAVVAEARGEIAGPLAELGDVFVLDLEGRNRYVMTAAETLAPLLDLPVAALAVEHAGAGRLRARNDGSVAALGIVLEGSPETFFSDNVLDLLPGETREIEYEGAFVRAEGWNAVAA